mgnify:CR=1 FL=1
MTHSEPPSDDAPAGFHTPIGSRRTFFQRMIGAAAACIGLGLSIPLLGYLVSPALKRRAQPWVDVGAVEDLSVSEPKPLDYVTSIRDGWMETTAHKAVWAIKRADGGVTVFSPICTHLGCGYRWEESDHAFKCPCHGSVYDREGKVLEGPAPRALDVLPAKIEHGRLLVMYKEFKAGLPVAKEL